MLPCIVSVSVSVSVFYDLAQLQNRVHCILYHTCHCMRIWHMYTLCTLHQYQIVSVCCDLLNYMWEYQHGNNLTFSRPVQLLRPPSCFRPETSWLLYMWAQVTVHSVQGVWRQRDMRAQASSQSVQGVWYGSICEHTRQPRTWIKWLMLWPDSSVRQSHGDRGINVPYR
jgi:hypothetical protein